MALLSLTRSHSLRDVGLPMRSPGLYVHPAWGVQAATSLLIWGGIEDRFTEPRLCQTLFQVLQMYLNLTEL